MFGSRSRYQALGSPVFWASGQPDNYRGEGQWYVYYWQSRGMEWDDDDKYEKKNFICEKPALPEPTAYPTRRPTQYPTIKRGVWEGSWELVTSGSGSSGSISFSIANGVEFTDGSRETVTEGFQSSTSSEISQKTKHTFHTKASVSAGLGPFGKATAEIGYKYENENGYTFGTSSTTSSSLAKSVSRSITEYQKTTGNQVCGGAGRQYVYQYVLENTHAKIHTNHFSCRPSPTQPSCPPLQCGDAYCDKCVAGTFEDPEIDKIASTIPAHSPTPEPIVDSSNNAVVIGAAVGSSVVALFLISFVVCNHRQKKADVAEVKQEIPVAKVVTEIAQV